MAEPVCSSQASAVVHRSELAVPNQKCPSLAGISLQQGLPRDASPQPNSG